MPRKRKDKQPIGTCDCPIKGCTESVPVFRYEGSGDPVRRRFEGRMYCVCPVHERVETQEYLLCNAKLNTPGDALKNPENKEQDASPLKPGDASPVVPTHPPKSSPKPSKWWHNLRPIIQ